jgi:folate-binding protein YgfZ
MQNTAKPEQWPSDFMTKIDDLSVIHTSGVEANKYLQGQITVNIDQLDQNQALLGCHCDFKGKTWNIFYALGAPNDINLICHQQSVESSLRELKKYGVFSKVDISDTSSDWEFLGGAGQHLTEIIETLFHAIPVKDKQVVHCDSGFVMRLDKPTPRYLLMLKHGAANAFVEEYPLPLSDSAVWNSLDIQAGIANIQDATSNQFVPQMMNMQALEAIDFKKGCYMGQEVVARTKYLGKNKRAAFILKCDADCDANAGDLLETQVGENWRRGGTIIRSASYNGETWLLAVLSNDSEFGQHLRHKDRPDRLFVVQPNAYTIEQ